MEETTTPFIRLNELVTAMLGEEKTVELFKSIRVTDIAYNNCDYGFATGHKKFMPETEGKSASIIYTVTVPTDEEVFVYFPSDWAREVELFLNGEEWGTYFGNETRRIVSLGTFLPKDQFTLQLKLKEDAVYIGTGVDYFWYLDTDVYKEIFPRLQTYDMNITDWSDTRIEGTFNKSADHTCLFTTLPYDEGWKITVDGVQMPIERTVGALLSVDCTLLSDGAHTVVMRYMPDCYVYGFFISVAGVILLLLCLLLRALIAGTKKRRAEAEEECVTSDRTVIPLAELLAEMEADRLPVQTSPSDGSAPAQSPAGPEDKDPLPEGAEIPAETAETAAQQSCQIAKETENTAASASGEKDAETQPSDPDAEQLPPEELADAGDVLAELFPDAAETASEADDTEAPENR